MWNEQETRDSVDAVCKECEDLTRQIAEAKEFNQLAAQSYDANVKGYRADLAEAREEIARLRNALEAIKHRGIPMTARDEYRRGFMEALSATRKVAVAALETIDG